MKDYVRCSRDTASVCSSSRSLSRAEMTVLHSLSGSGGVLDLHSFTKIVFVFLKAVPCRFTCRLQVSDHLRGIICQAEPYLCSSLLNCPTEKVLPIKISYRQGTHDSNVRRDVIVQGIGTPRTRKPGLLPREEQNSWKERRPHQSYPSTTPPELSKHLGDGCSSVWLRHVIRSCLRKWRTPIVMRQVSPIVVESLRNAWFLHMLLLSFLPLRDPHCCTIVSKSH
jgi:hypothetical protein